jgi:hypothetical protein
MADFCQICIPNFALLSKLLSEAPKERQKGAPLLGKGCQQACEVVKTKVSQAPALGPPNLENSLSPCMNIRDKELSWES